ncbi:FKBP-type peptidyl-prolyl cis-trans isomerase [Mucilaginibacter sp. BT774]|uniref:FKBP-type peptidyl-prolyl cis-trans isomerase n=1 Tax=Mucilaginibacter sp. BT774 TaxID=3062276 RepID=UPI0026762380|nr:FKBP-type peptidyl-prolyl cis-trans isomerase [Mucilaginibacter sp. BT774]MDO3626989.1 FKBP-type peptidyl-prolyl cis-trans isomerase [Mucilaginibacter sp. BT774]
MSKWLLPIVCVCCIMAGCTKEQTGLAQYKKQAAIDDKIVTDYINANGLKDVAKKVADTCGVYYILLEPGQGNDLYTTSTYVTVGDTARVLGQTTPFYKTNNIHPSYQLGQVILGWRLGIPKSQVHKGGRIRLLVPSRYAYGPYPQTDYNLPKNSILDFYIRVYNITN